MKTMDKKKKFHNNKNSKYKKHKESEEISSINEIRKKIGELDPDSITNFSILPLCEATQKGLKESKFTEPTKVQKQTLVHSLQGLDVVGEAKTGSGKTLAFVIPILELLYTKCWNIMDGLGVVVITPTRELAYQIYEVFNKVGKYHAFSVGLVIGGKDLKFEWKRIRTCNIIICTPGRFLQHMLENPDFNYDSVQMLVLDEADRCLSMGFEDSMNTILEELPKQRQTLLFSATQTRDVKSLIRAGCKTPVFCSVHENSKTGTPKTLKESYMVCEEADKIKFLSSFLKHHKKFKILVFLSTCKQTKFIHNLFTHLRPGLTVMSLHGGMHQLKRMAVYDEFCNKKYAVLFATDIAARGLDIPSVDWVLQLDCPEDVTTYIHRVGRTARHTQSGEALLVLTPAQEVAMVKSLKEKNITVEMISVDPSKLQNVQLKIECVLSKYTYLKEEAERAFKSYIKNMWFMKNKNILDITSLDLESLARSLGLTVTPRVRFHEKKIKKLQSENGVKLKTDEKSQKKASSLGILQDDDSEDDFLFKSESQPTAEVGNPEDILKDYSVFMNPAKETVSKYDVVKKALKMKIQLNNRVVFDEEGNLASGSEEVNEENHTGIDLSERQEFLREQDKLDKIQNSERVREKHKVEKAKLKALQQKKTDDDEEIGEEEEEKEGEEIEEDVDEDSDMDSETNQIIDELPDPDRIYNRRDEDESNSNECEDESNSDESEEESESSSEEELKSKHSKKKEILKTRIKTDKAKEDMNSDDKNEKSKRIFSGKRKAKEDARAAKKAKIVAENDFSSISCSEKESLALYLLQGT